MIVALGFGNEWESLEEAVVPLPAKIEGVAFCYYDG